VPVETNTVEVYKSIKRNENALISWALFNVFMRVCLKPETLNLALPIINSELIRLDPVTQMSKTLRIMSFLIVRAKTITSWIISYVVFAFSMIFIRQKKSEDQA